jgi:hypothetical protein
MGLFGGKKHECQNCSACSRSLASKVVRTATGVNTVGKAAYGATAGVFMQKCGVCGHYQNQHDYRKYGGR